MSALAFAAQRLETLPYCDNELSPTYLRLTTMTLIELMDSAATGYSEFFTTADKGMDLIYARQVLLIKALEYPDIKLNCVIPHKDQSRGWNNDWLSRYDVVINGADACVQISQRYTQDCQQRSYEYMVDRSDTLLAIYDGKAAGIILEAIAYANRQNKRIIIINPITLERIESAPKLCIL